MSDPREAPTTMTSEPTKTTPTDGETPPTTASAPSTTPPAMASQTPATASEAQPTASEVRPTAGEAQRSSASAAGAARPTGAGEASGAVAGEAALVRVEIRHQPGDFRVDEIPAYEPIGQGEHLYVHLRKTGLDTMAAVQLLARRLGVQARDGGTAGLKDRHAITTQHVSFPWPLRRDLPEASALSGDGIEVLSVNRHNNKLRTGHLHGNRFTLVLRGIEASERAGLAAAIERLGVTGLPNRFGGQRFGRFGDNAAQARAWLAGRQPAPRNPRIRRLQFSALQSEIFHRVLDRRIADGTWDSVIEGDLLQGPDGGRLLRSAQVDDALEAVRSGRLSASGPIYGARMPWPDGAAKQLEEQVLGEGLEDRALIDRHRQLGEGARRPLRLVPQGVRVSTEGLDATSLQVEFVLPRGAYATTVLEAVSTVDDVSRRAANAREVSTIEDEEEGPENER